MRRAPRSRLSGAPGPGWEIPAEVFLTDATLMRRQAAPRLSMHPRAAVNTSLRALLRELVMISADAIRGAMTKMLYFSIAAAVLVFVSMLLLTGLHP